MKAIFLCIAVLFMAACKKEKSCENCIDKIVIDSARIVFTGNIGADGCGWLIKTDTTNCLP